MKVLPLAFDSMGVRSMCTFLEVGKLKLLIDPGVALGPTRYGLGPTKEEWKALELSRALIMEAAGRAKAVAVTHYHYDHHPFPEDGEMYERCFGGKMVMAKDRKKNINLSGKKRGALFEERVVRVTDRLEWADGREFEVGERVEFSPAVWHGDVGSKVGTVIMVYVEKGGFLFGSDAQSLADPEALKWVLEKNPEFMILDGYPTIFVGWRMSQKAFEASLENLKRAVEETQAETILLEHHILRDLNYKEKMEAVFKAAERKGKRLLSAAEFLGLENFFLEAWRRELSEGKRRVEVEEYYKKLCSKVGVAFSSLKSKGMERRIGLE
ncbi:MAG: MBL fold metallo-hydrolase [Hadesarchaea archaeon]|nr:MAG: MBL fold metallo-hydrolase [Hadesarchaea archaeon]